MVQDKKGQISMQRTVQEFNNYLCKRSVLLPNDNNDTQLSTQMQKQAKRKKV